MNIIALGTEFVIQTAFLTAALWALLKIQKLQYHLPGVIGAAALASGLDMIPWVGHALAFAALLLTMVVVTHEDVTGIIFTIAISYALTFGMNLWLMGSLMGDLRISAREPETSLLADEQDDEDDDAATAEAAPGTEKTALAQKAATAEKPALTGTNALAAKAEATETPTPKRPSQAGQGLKLKGVVNGGKSYSAIVAFQSQTYTLVPGDSMRMDTAAGRKDVRLVEVKEDTVTLDIEGERVVVGK